MKYLKKFENNNEIEIGDYVLCSYDTDNMSYNIKNLSNFISNNIGVVIDNSDEYNIDIKYDNVPENIKMFFNGKDSNIRLGTERYLVLAFGKTIKDIEIYITANKYNI